jgi:hypothetical protein
MIHRHLQIDLVYGHSMYSVPSTFLVKVCIVLPLRMCESLNIVNYMCSAWLILELTL